MNTELFKSEESKLKLYKDYIRQCTSASSSVENYSDFSLLDELIKKRYPNFTSLITIDDPNELQKIYDDLSKLPSFEEFNGKPNEGKPFKKIGNGQYHNALLTYIRFLNAIRLLNKGTIKITEKPDSLDKQIIFYGAPGTGKSFEVNKRVESLLAGMSEEEREKHKFRTTFHPDSDYASFVGCYKPVEKKTEPSVQTELLDETQLIEKLKEYLKNNKVMTNAYVQFGYDYCDSLKNYIADVNNKLITIVKAARGSNDATTFDTTVKAGMELFENQMKESLTGSKITYSFVPQTFAKAYVAAWKSHVYQPRLKGQQSPSKPTIKVKTDTYTLDEVIAEAKDEIIYYTKVSLLEKGVFEKSVKSCWEKLQNDSNANINNELPQAAVRYWCNHTKPNIHTAEDCWKAFWEELEHGETIGSIARDNGNQTYFFSLEEGKVAITTKGSAFRDTISGIFGGKTKGKKNKDVLIQKLIADKLKKDYSQDFEKAWNKLKEEINKKSDQSSDIADTDSVLPIFLIIEEINRGNCAQIFGDLFQLLDRDKKGLSEYAIDADADLADYIKKELADCDGDFPAGVKEGKKLVLPPNLYIWATMNTSDQSLFPMDSAFKRRWSWKYVPIDYSHKDSSKFEIEIDGAKYSWPNFLRKINEEIKNLTYSEDKQMGNFFIKHSIGLDEFRDKVMFYLWSEIGKENYKTKDAIFFYNDGDKESQEFSFNELYGDKEEATKILKGFMDYIDKKYSDKFKNCSILKSEKKEQNQDTGSTPAVNSNEEIQLSNEE